MLNINDKKSRQLSNLVRLYYDLTFAKMYTRGCA